MAIRIVDKKGVSDTEAELLVSSYPNGTSVYCSDTQNTFTRITNIWVSGNCIGVEDDITVIDEVTNYFFDTANAGKVITVTLPDNLSEGTMFTFKRADSSTSLIYDIIFTTSNSTIDFDTNDYILSAANEYKSINLVKFASNFNITASYSNESAASSGIPVLTSDPISPINNEQWFLNQLITTPVLSAMIGGFPHTIDVTTTQIDLKIYKNGNKYKVNLTQE